MCEHERAKENERKTACQVRKDYLLFPLRFGTLFMCCWNLTFVNFTSCTTLFLWDFLFFCSIDTVSLISYRSSLLFGKRRMVQNVPLRPFRNRFNPWWWWVLALMQHLLGGRDNMGILTVKSLGFLYYNVSITLTFQDFCFWN